MNCAYESDWQQGLLVQADRDFTLMLILIYLHCCVNVLSKFDIRFFKK